MASLLLILSVLLVFGGGLLVITQFLSLFTSAPFVPSASDRVRTMIALAELGPGEHVADLGSGDGRLLIAAVARTRVTAEGWEQNPLLAWWSRAAVRARGLGEGVSIHRGSYRGRDFRHVNVVFLYVLPSEMARLERWLPAAMRPDARVIVNAFPFPNWTAERVEGNVYRYRVPNVKREAWNT